MCKNISAVCRETRQAGSDPELTSLLPFDLTREELDEWRWGKDKEAKLNRSPSEQRSAAKDRVRSQR